MHHLYKRQINPQNSIVAMKNILIKSAFGEIAARATDTIAHPTLANSIASWTQRRPLWLALSIDHVNMGMSQGGEWRVVAYK